ncbi:hypothetical protein EW146_g4334 [Bondarzewia mesenterica]|uniref:CCHC-type domain-containing protein n=1 Tax=Bondarzewia mesenterica TaxID=1095465 RepID=A0A4S4LX38_9AGAM|nr:hypothetical protein EW146_g4334 [Bondarzewia mesenterica]
MASNSTSLGVYILPEAERLTRANWPDWSARIYLVCQVQGLEPYLLGTILPPSARTDPAVLGTTPSTPATPPVVVAAPGSPATGTPATTPATTPLPASPTLAHHAPAQASPYAPAATSISAFFPIAIPAIPAGLVTYAVSNNEWAERDMLARAHLVLNVADITGTSLVIGGSAADAWRSLRNRFELQDPIVVQDMRLRLTTTWYEDGTSVTEHFKTMRELLNTANRAGAGISESEFCQMVLMTFPVDGILGTVVMTLLTCRDSMVAESVLSSQELRIRTAATRRANLSSNPAPNIPGNTALVAAQRPRCSHCGKLGHATEKCWADGGQAAHQRPDWWGRRCDRGSGGHGRVPEQNGNHGANLALGPNIAFTAGGPVSAPGVSLKTYSDSGATYHYFTDQRDFVVYEPLLKPEAGRAAGLRGFTISGTGLVVKDTLINGKRVTRHLQAMHSPDMGQNLLSTRQFDREGGRVWTENGRTVITGASGERLFESDSSTAGLYEIQLYQPSAECIVRARFSATRSHDEVVAMSASQSKAVDIAMWHRRLGHVGMQAAQRAAKAVNGMDVKIGEVVGICEDCMAGRQTHRPFDEVVERETEVGERIHGDLMGPMLTVSLGGKCYAFGMRDGHSTWVDAAFLTSKTAKEILGAMKAFVS